MAPSLAAESPPPVLDRFLAGELRGIVGPEAVITEPDRLLSYESDGLTAYRHPPRAVVLPRDTEEASRVVACLHEAGVPVVPRGAGTGLSGGALALGGAVLVGTARMDRILALDRDARLARVEAGVVNARLSEAARPHGLHYAPDPSSQSACTLGGNVAENSGGPHCLKYGVTSRYVTGLTLVLPDGEVAELGGAARDASGYDLVGAVVGSEGCFGLVTEIELRLVPIPQAVRTLLAVFGEIEDAGRAVTRILREGLLPAALEIIDAETIRAVEASVFAAGYPVDAGAVLVVELDGTGAGLDDEAAAAEEACRSEGAREVRRATTEDERAALWKGRKKAFGAMGRIAPDLLVQDATVPRSRLPEVLARVGEIGRRHGLTVANVFHAGDGNLHPNILFDRRDRRTVERVEKASWEMMKACVEAGGTITGEHGVGIDKRDYMRLVYGSRELAAMAAVKEAFDPGGRFNPGKVLPDGVEPPSRGGTGNGEPVPDPGPDRRPASPAGGGGGPAGREPGSRPDAAALVQRVLGADALGDDPDAWVARGRRPAAVAFPADDEEAGELLRAASASGLRVLPAGRGSWLEGGPSPGPIDLVVSTRRMDRILQYEPADLTLTAGAGLALDALAATAGEHGQWLPLDPPGRPDGTLGATVATASGGFLQTRYGSIRDLVLGLTLVTGDGRVLRLGGRVVKNVAGFDLVRLAVGSWGTLGVVTAATVLLQPRPRATVRLRACAGRMEELLPAARAAARAPFLPAALELRESPAPGGGREAVLAVTLHGHEASVRAEARMLRDAAPLLEEAEGELEVPEPAREPDLVVRMRLPTGRTDTLVEVVRTLGRLEGGRNVLEGAPVVHRIDPVGVVAWVLVPNVRADDAWAERWAVRLDDLRRTMLVRGGGLTVESAPSSIADRVGAWPRPEGAEAMLVRRVRERFDPERILAPGRFAFEGAGPPAAVAVAPPGRMR